MLDCSFGSSRFLCSQKVQNLSNLGMATGWVHAGFFHTRTRPAGLPWKPELGPFTKQMFFLSPKLGPSGTCGARQPCHKFRFMIFPFKITNTQTQKQTQKFQIYDFPFQNHKHKQLTWLRQYEPKKKKKEKKIENEVVLKILWEWMTQSRSSMYAKLPKIDMRDDERS